MVLLRIKALAAAAVMFFCSLFGIEYRGRALDLNRLESGVSASQNARLENGALTGAQIIVYQNSEKKLSAVYGLKNAGGKALAGDEIYRIASMTKPVTAFALLMEYDRGNIDIYADVSDYLPAFSDMYLAKRSDDGSILRDEKGRALKGGKAKNPIKVYQLVSHTSGVGDVPGAGGITTLDSAVEYLESQPLCFEPGTAQEYSTGAFDLAAKIIENSSGLEFEDYLRQNIFTPLGMTDTTFEPDEAQWARVAGMHNRGGDGRAFDEPTVPGCVFGDYPVSYHAAGAGLVSTAEDYLKFAVMLLDGGAAPDGTRLVSEKSFRLFITPVTDNKIMPGNTKWGLGVRVITGYDHTLPKGSYGWSGAYGTHFWIDPVNRIAAVYMKNSVFDGGAGCMTGEEFEKDVMKSLGWF